MNTPYRFVRFRAEEAQQPQGETIPYVGWLGLLVSLLAFSREPWGQSLAMVL